MMSRFQVADDLREAMEKMAEAVARRGMELEEITRKHQQHNPKFAFLDPMNNYHGFYRSRVAYHKRRLGQVKEQQKQSLVSQHQQGIVRPPVPPQLQQMQHQPIMHTQQAAPLSTPFLIQQQPSQQMATPFLQQPAPPTRLFGVGSNMPAQQQLQRARNAIRIPPPPANFELFHILLDNIISTGETIHYTNATIWVFEQCQSIHDIKKAIVTIEELLVGERKRGEHVKRSRCLYLAHDILYHATRLGRNDFCDAVIEALPAMLHALVHYSDQGEVEAMEMLELWKNDGILTPTHCILISEKAHNVVPPRPLSLTALRDPSQNYFEIPAGHLVGLVTPENDFRSLDQRDVSGLFPMKGNPTEEVMNALKDFFTPNENKLTADGWEKGALDDHYNKRKKSKDKNEDYKDDEEEYEQERPSFGGGSGKHHSHHRHH
eukprot:m.100529 g.100529  ORF g.100529 m.100529 type:complete len:433 (-) comp9046_c4_seq1:1479-2777(-)